MSVKGAAVKRLFFIYKPQNIRTSEPQNIRTSEFQNLKIFPL